MTRAWLGLGSNEGDRLANLRAAVARITALDGVEVERCSSVYETEPVGQVPDQRDFYNAAVRVRTGLGPPALLDACKRVERELGRRPGRHHGPRPIDVDLLLYGGAVLVTERLRLPHPEIVGRRFVLVPLLELDPELTLPGGGTLQDALAALPAGQRVVRVGSLECS